MLKLYWTWGADPGCDGINVGWLGLILHAQARKLPSNHWTDLFLNIQYLFKKKVKYIKTHFHGCMIVGVLSFLKDNSDNKKRRITCIKIHITCKGLLLKYVFRVYFILVNMACKSQVYKEMVYACVRCIIIFILMANLLLGKSILHLLNVLLFFFCKFFLTSKLQPNWLYFSGWCFFFFIPFSFFLFFPLILEKLQLK